MSTKFGMVVITSKMTTIVNNFELGLLARELSSVFPARSFSNKFAQLQRLARKLKFHNGNYRYDTFQRGNNKGAEQTSQCTGWSAPLLFATWPLRSRIYD